MKRATLCKFKSFFKIFHTTKRSQTGLMRLPPGGESGPEPEAHAGSDQAMLVVEGEVTVQLGRKRLKMKAGDFVVIPAKTRHRLTNAGKNPALTFNVDSPPEYPPNMDE